ncbi:MAG: Gfo/Idh/MocA family oxidoreductase [Pseudomonadota bacterium]
MSAALPLCVVGGGLVGLRHARLAAEHPHVALVAVVETDPVRRAALADQGLPAVSDLDAVTGAEAAIVATPTPDHAATGLAAIGRGWAVLVEKPIAACLDQADALCTAAEARGVPLLTGHHRRCHPFVTAAQGVLAELGPLVALQGLWSLRKPEDYFVPAWRRQPGAGPIMTNLNHDIDLVRCLAGDIARVATMTSSAARGMAIEDTAALTFEMASGALGAFVISDAGASPWAFEAASGENPHIAWSGEDCLRLIGTRASLAFPSLRLWYADRPEGADWSHPLAHRPGPTLARIDPLAAQLARFAVVAAGGEDPGLADGAEGRATLEMTLATHLAAETGRPVARGGVPGGYGGPTALPTTPEDPR